MRSKDLSIGLFAVIQIGVGNSDELWCIFDMFKFVINKYD